MGNTEATLYFGLFDVMRSVLAGASKLPATAIGARLTGITVRRRDRKHDSARLLGQSVVLCAVFEFFTT